MKPRYNDATYMVYIWGFSYLDYSFDVLTSQIDNLGLYNWFYHIYFTCYLFTCSCMLMLMTRFSIHALWLGFINTRVIIYARHLVFTAPLVGEFWLPWTCMFKSWSLDRGGLLGDQSCAAVTSWISSWLSGALSFQASCLSLEFFFCNSWTSFVLFIIVYLFLFSHLNLSVM